MGNHPSHVSIGEILANIQGGKWAKPIATIREVYNEALAMEGPEEAKEAIKELKKKLPAFLATGVFTKRKNEKLDVPSGLMIIDLDNDQNSDAIRATLASDPYVAADWLSPSGSGLKVIVNIRPDASLYSRTFKAARLHFQKHGLIVDESGKDPARLCFVSHDQALHMRNGDVQIMEPLPQEGPEPDQSSPQDCSNVELTPQLETRIKRYLDKVRPAIQGDHGSNPAFRVASVLVWGFALSFKDARPFMCSYSKKCQPPWSAKEIDHKLVDARKPEKQKGRGPRGHLIGATDGGNGEYGDFFDGKKKLPELDSADQFCIEPDDTPPEIIEGILHQGSKGELGGGSKTFKTWTLLQMGACVAHGIPWLGHNTHCGKVLFINFELPRWSIRYRVKQMCEALEASYPSNLKLLNLRGYATDAHTILPRIAKEIRKHGFALVIIDPLYKILGDREENATKDMADLMLAIERLAVFLSAAVLFGAHFSKGNQSLKEAMDRISGSGVLARDPDTIITMTQHEENNAYTVDMILRNFPPQDPFVIRREHPLMMRANGLDPSKLKKPKKSNQAVYSSADLLDVLDENGGSLAYNEWRDRCHAKSGMSPGTFYGRFKELRDANKIFFSAMDQKWSRRP